MCLLIFLMYSLRLVLPGQHVPVGPDSIRTDGTVYFEFDWLELKVVFVLGQGHCLTLNWMQS